MFPCVGTGRDRNFLSLHNAGGTYIHYALSQVDGYSCRP